MKSQKRCIAEEKKQIKQLKNLSLDEQIQKKGRRSIDSCRTWGESALD